MNERTQPRASVGRAAAWGALLGLPWLLLQWLGNRLAGLPLVAIDLFEWLVRTIPGEAGLTAGLELMIRTLQSLQLGATDALGKALETGMAYLAALLLLAVVGAGSAWSQRGRPQFGPLLPTTLLWLLSILITAQGGWGQPGPTPAALWLLALGAAWGVGLSAILQPQAAADPEAPGRRRALAFFGWGALGLGALSLGLARWLGRSETQLDPNATSFLTDPTQTPPPSDFTPFPGTRPEVSPLETFYRVDINLLVPDAGAVSRAAGRAAAPLAGRGGLPEEDFILLVDGLVDQARIFTLSELRALPGVEQFATLECISNNVGGDLIDTTTFTGVRLRDVLAEVGLKPDAVEIRFACADAYSESLPIDSALDERTLLCYAMGGQSLTQEHGFPLRLYTPDRYGMKNPKWIIQVEAVAEPYFGYWEQRGWDKQAWVKTTSIIDAADSLAPGILEAGGIAFAGARGVAGVELQLDEGPWVPAELERPLSELAWVRWRARLEGPVGEHRLRVRAIERSGAVQDRTPADTYPDGASGYHEIGIQIRGQA